MRRLHPLDLRAQLPAPFPLGLPGPPYPLEQLRLPLALTLEPAHVTPQPLPAQPAASRAHATPRPWRESPGTGRPASRRAQRAPTREQPSADDRRLSGCRVGQKRHGSADQSCHHNSSDDLRTPLPPARPIPLLALAQTFNGDTQTRHAVAPAGVSPLGCPETSAWDEKEEPGGARWRVLFCSRSGTGRRPGVLSF